MAAPNIHNFLLKNNDIADVIFPWLFDANGNTIWKGSEPIHPGHYKIFDLATVTNPPPDQSVVILGCSVQGKQEPYKDPKSPRTYKKESIDQATGNYKAGKFTVEPPSMSASPEVAAALQEAYAKLNTTSVAKFLISVAGLISPELK